MKANDTSPEAQAVLTEVYRRMTPADRWRRVAEAFELGKRLHAAGFRLRAPDADDRALRRDWFNLMLRRQLPEPLLERLTTLPAADATEALRGLIRQLRAVDIPFVLGGSIASSVFGVPRFTQSADLTAEPFLGREDAFAAALGDDYYMSPDAARQAFQDRSSFNVIHLSSGFKIDVFVRKDRPFDVSIFARRQALSVPDMPDCPVDLVSPADIVLLKLEGYRLGGEISDRQWSDVLGVLRVQAGRLDEAYLDHWAAELGLSDLLARARLEAKTEGDR